MAKLTMPNIDLSSNYFDFLDNFSQVLSFGAKEKLGILVAIIITFASVSYFFIISPSLEDIARIDTTISKQETANKKFKRLASNIKKGREEYKLLQQQFEDAKSMLPKKSQIPDLLDGINQAAMSSGLKFSTFQPESEVAHAGIYSEVPVSFSVESGFPQWMNFLDSVGEMKRIVDVKKVKIKTTDRADILKISGKIVTYRFIEANDLK